MSELEQIVSAPQKAVLKSIAPINLFLAGVGSGKTHLLGIKTYQLIKKFPKVRGFIGANTYLQLVQSTLFRIREYWKSIGVVEYDKESRPYGQYVINKKPPAHFNTEGHNFDDYYGIISFANGCVVFIGSLERASSHEGKEFGWSVLDETKDTDETDVKEIIIARIRQKGMYIVDGMLSDTGTPEQQFNPLFIATSPAKVDWINEWFGLDSYVDEITQKIYSRTDFFQKHINDKFAVISSTYHNIHNVGENYINNVLQNNSEERGKALIYGNPFSQTGGEFYSSFDRLKHVGNVRYDPSLPIHISFDQNSVPYNSASIWQVKQIDDIWELRAIDEIALQNPRNSTEEVCEEFMFRYPNHKAGLFYYGDASGHNRSTMNKDFKHHYEIVRFKLNRYLINASDRTLISNPSLVLRRDFMNKIFEGRLPIRIVIDEGCHYTINDFMYVKQAIDGGKDKHIVTDKETGEKYQKYGHLSDCADYLIVELFKTYYNG
ncbi:MAG: terminase family protein [Nitrospira sp.]|nr:terminase family protein [Nitrospira sp.]